MIKKEKEEAGEEGKVFLVRKDIYLFGDISNGSVGSFTSALHEADTAEGPNIIHICSQGGWLEGGFAMYDAIKSCNNRVITIASGAVYSAAVLPFQAGDTRLMNPNSYVMMHPTTIELMAYGVDFMKSVQLQTEKMEEAYCKIVAERSGQTYEHVRKLCSGESFFDAKDSVKLGFADGILKPTKKVQYGKTKRVVKKK